MADDPVTPPEARDEALTRALEVEPLDDLTRRRLVGTALAAAAGEVPRTAPAQGSARARAPGVAAAAIAFVVLGVAALTLPGGDGADLATRESRSLQDGATTPRAAGAPTTTPAGGNPASDSDASAASSAIPRPAANESTRSRASTAADASLPDLGQLGELSDPGARARVVAAAAPLVAGVAPQRWSFTFQACAPHTVDVVASGLGTLDGDPVQVLVSRRADGTLRVRSIDGTTCELRSLP